MKKNTKKLLEKVATKKLEEALSEEKNDEEKSKSLKDWLDAIDKLKDVDKEANNHKSGWVDKAIKIAEIAVIPIVLMTIEFKQKSSYARMLTEWEESGNILTNSASRQLPNTLFKWKK